MSRTILALLIIGLAGAQQRSLSTTSTFRGNRLIAGREESTDFHCLNDFGYYSHPTDCSKYYVCVFGGALLESCTGGLMYSTELQTCDWPQNVVCEAKNQELVPRAITDPRTTARTRSSSPTKQTLTVDNSIRAAETTPRRVSDPNKSRKGRILTRDSSAKQQRRGGFQAEETSSHSFNVVPSNTNSKNSFTPNIPPIPTTNQIAPTRSTSNAATTGPGINGTDDDYYFYYYDYLEDDAFFKAPTAAPVTQAPRRASPSRSASRGSTKHQNSIPSTQFSSSQSNSRGKPVTSAKSRNGQKLSKNSPSRTPSKKSKSGDSQTVGRSPQRLVRPSKKPKPAFQSHIELITDVWNYPAKRPAARSSQPPVGSPAERCTPQNCQLPDCFCGGTPIPGGLSPTNVPQQVLLTFDDSVNDLNKKLYQDLFERGRVNPNGCPIAATFYVSHEWTDYSQLQNLYADGHEIASHSITHSFGEQFSISKWAKEISGQREIMSAYAGVRMEDIRGMRAPFLAVGGDNMFQMLYDQNFTYDSSMPVYDSKPPSWPYTLDRKIFHDCMIPPCPKKAFPGVWEVPMVMWTDLTGGRCSMVDACQAPADAKGIYDMLVKNFERHYTTNRAPLGLYFHSAWFGKPHHKEGFTAFLDTISSMDDVWLVSSWQSIQYTRSPVSISEAKSFKPFQCNYPERPARCASSRVCNVWHKGSVRYMKTCQSCPADYPWVGRTGVQSPLNDI